MNEGLKPRCAKCQGWRQTRGEEAVTLVNGTALCAWHAKEGERDELARLRAENEALKKERNYLMHWSEKHAEQAEAAEAKVAAVEKEREEALDQAGEHAAVASALQERVKELRAANERDRDQWAEDIEKVPALTAKVASMEKVVEAAILYRDSIRNGSSGLEAVNPAAGIFDRAVHALSRLTAAPGEHYCEGAKKMRPYGQTACSSCPPAPEKPGITVADVVAVHERFNPSAPEGKPCVACGGEKGWWEGCIRPDRTLWIPCQSCCPPSPGKGG